MRTKVPNLCLCLKLPINSSSITCPIFYLDPHEELRKNLSLFDLYNMLPFFFCVCFIKMAEWFKLVTGMMVKMFNCHCLWSASPTILTSWLFPIPFTDPPVQGSILKEIACSPPMSASKYGTGNSDDGSSYLKVPIWKTMHTVGTVPAVMRVPTFRPHPVTISGKCFIVHPDHFDLGDQHHYFIPDYYSMYINRERIEFTCIFDGDVMAKYTG